MLHVMTFLSYTWHKNTFPEIDELQCDTYYGKYIYIIILYNILKIAELDCCQIIILSIYVPSTHAYTHVLPICLTRKGNTMIIEAPFLGSGCGRVV